MIQLILLLLLSTGIEGSSNYDQQLGVVCSDITIKEDFKGSFREYENCTVAEGNVQITLSDDCSPDFYKTIRFPKLKEIIGYLFVYRIFKVSSLGDIFPSLVVIRGNSLFYGYAFIVYEMMDLQVLGLGNFTRILHGAVRIQKNPKLCYLDTVDWDEITGSRNITNIIVENRVHAHCPHNCSPNCPRIKKNGIEQQFCWSPSQCQKKYDQACGNQTYSYHGGCCDTECLGGCTGNSRADCISCKHVIFKRCQRKCPVSTYLYKGWRCLIEDECRKMPSPQHETSPIYWKAINGSCTAECPQGYVEEMLNKNNCKKCQGTCPKICPEAVVDSIESAGKLYGCTHINGSLTIQIKGNNVIRELERNLGTIQEITNYLKIARCPSILSLNFLRELTTIHGEKVTSRRYAFVVLDNVNLENLWDWNHRQKLFIKNGTLSFHFNPKLCLQKIEEMKQHTEAPGWNNISLVSNGHRIACEIKHINISLVRTGPEIAVIRVTNYHRVLSDPRSLLSYVAYYRKAPFQNVTTYGGRDACGTNNWKAVDIEKEEKIIEKGPKQQVSGSFKEDEDIYCIITHLRPFTQYAIYAKTLTVASRLESAYSPIIYFTTKPDTPSPPTDVKAQANIDGTVEVIWKPSRRPNGIVTRYTVLIVKEEDPAEFISQRNYCEESLILSDVKKQFEETVVTTTPAVSTVNPNITKPSPAEKECCDCVEPTISGEEEAEYRMQFEDFLQNTAFVKHSRPLVRRQAASSSHKNANKKKASEIPNSTEPTISSMQTSSDVTVSSSTLSSPNVLVNENVPVNETSSSSLNAPLDLSDSDNSSEPVLPTRTHIEILGETIFRTSVLHHFTEYTFKISACHAESSGGACSAEAITTVRTLPNRYADDVNSTTVRIDTENATSGIVYVKWNEPSSPNGLLVSHHIEYKNMDKKNDKAIPICITHEKFQLFGGYQLSELSAGNYSLRIRATSLAGNGNWTSPVYFYIPESKSILTKEHLVVIVVCCLGSVAFCIFLGVWFMYKKRNSLPDGIIYTSVNPEYISSILVYEPDEWEVDREKISLLRELGQGSFGMVYEGIARDILPGKHVTKCAIKTVNESASDREKIEFLQEASVMKAFNCNHVVKLLGVVSKGQPVLVIMELMACGDLKTYLRSHRPEENPNAQPPTLKLTLQMALQIADGMAYLAAKKFVHRDLAARNCMVAEDLTVKIGDFGMTRDIYETDYYRKGGKGLLPVRWMAPESLQDGIFTSQSDVWSYGVVIWEMTTLASQPYQGLSNEQVLKYVMHGGIMEKPENCPQILFDLMMRCWSYSPSGRPTFINIIEELIQHVLTPQFQKESFYFSQNETVPPTSLPSENLSASNLDADLDFCYFPGSAVQENNHNNEESSSDGEDSFDDGNMCEMTQEQVNVSDGSKGSKISDASNGHIFFRANRTTEC